MAENESFNASSARNARTVVLVEHVLCSVGCFKQGRRERNLSLIKHGVNQSMQITGWMAMNVLRCTILVRSNPKDNEHPKFIRSRRAFDEETFRFNSQSHLRVKFRVKFNLTSPGEVISPSETKVIERTNFRRGDQTNGTIQSWTRVFSLSKSRDRIEFESFRTGSIFLSFAAWPRESQV